MPASQIPNSRPEGGLALRKQRSNGGPELRTKPLIEILLVPVRVRLGGKGKRPLQGRLLRLLSLTQFCKGRGCSLFTGREYARPWYIFPVEYGIQLDETTITCVLSRLV